jgi:hypothetical protein
MFFYLRVCVQDGIADAVKIKQMEESKQQTFIFENGEQQTCMATCHGVMTWQQLTSIDLYIVVVLYLHCDRYFVCRD